MNYTYDGTFEGLLSVVFTVFEKRDSRAVIEKKRDGALFGGIYVDTDISKAERVYKKLCRVAGQKEANRLYTAFLSERSGIENTLLAYIRGVIEEKSSIERIYMDAVVEVERFSLRVVREAHRFKGFVRFRRLSDDTYYAIIEPECNVLPLVESHFTERFSDQNFVIHDMGREAALVYSKDNRKGYIARLTDINEELISYSSESTLLHTEEERYIDLWRGYFEAVSIEGRKNLRCQQNFMPKKYWKNLTEVNMK